MGADLGADLEADFGVDLEADLRADLASQKLFDPLVPKDFFNMRKVWEKEVIACVECREISTRPCLRVTN